MDFAKIFRVKKLPFCCTGLRLRIQSDILDGTAFEALPLKKSVEALLTCRHSTYMLGHTNYSLSALSWRVKAR